ncbi:MAG: hypothetical protein R3C03_20215 [Pirellulaceae bacterium]
MRPYQELVENLNLIQNFNQYIRVGNDLEFLKELSDPDLFGTEQQTTSSDRELTLPRTFAEKESMLSGMSSDQLKATSYRKEQFDSLSPEDRVSIRTFHNQILKEPNAEELVEVAQRFYDWQKTLEQRDQWELASQESVDAKIEKIKSIRLLQSEEVDRLPNSDFENFDQWIRDIAEKYGQAINEQMSQMRRLSPEIRNAILASPETATRAYIRIFPDAELIPAEEFANLRRQLSSAAQKIMGDDKREELQFVRQMLTRPQISEAELRAFYYNELSNDEREELDRRSPEVWKDEIRKLYMRRKLLLIRSR